MIAEDWARLRALFEALCDLPLPEQQARLDAAQLDALLRRCLQAMLDGDRAGRLRSDARAQAPQLTRSLAQDELIDSVLGHYRIEALIGVGGMGRVYRARREDGRYEAKVAIKFVAEGASAERFRREREVLARLAHPGIARLIDADEDSAGRPYLVMEYVEGESLDRHCQVHRLDDAARIQLVIEAARAIAYAHERLVLHRDLKPANVLVDTQGRVKILDFGIAKLIDVDSADATQTAARFFTLRYAAPDQIAGEPVGMAADVYALAVMLYELLSGQHPFLEREEDAAALAERVLTTESIALRTALRRVRRRSSLSSDRLRDVEAVLQHALVRDPAHSYGSAQAFGEDLRRVLDDRPVSVRALSLSSVARRWLWRHRALTAAMALALLSLILGLAVSIWQAGIARSERDAALREAERTERMAAFLTGMFEAAQPLQSRGGDLKARDLIDLGRERLTRELTDEPLLRAQLQATIADSYRALGLYEESEKLLMQALETEVPDPDRALLSARLNMQLGRLHTFQRRWREAEERLSLALGTARSIGDNELTGTVLRHLAITHINRHRWDEAKVAVVEALKLARDGDESNWRDVANSEMLLATIAFGQGDTVAARDAYLRLVDAQRTAQGADGLLLMTSLNNLAAVQSRLDEPEVAERNYRESARIARLHFGETHPDLALPLLGLGTTLRAQGRYEEALTALAQSRSIYTNWVGDNHDATAYARLLHAELLWLLGRSVSARTELALADQVLFTANGRQHPHACRSALLRHALEDAVVFDNAMSAQEAVQACKTNIQAAPSVRLLARWAEVRATRNASPQVIGEIVLASRQLIPRDAALSAAIDAWAGRIRQP